jgi:hypothetical protein
MFFSQTAVNGVFEIRHGRRFASILKQIEVVIAMVGVDFSGQTLKLECYCSHMSGIALKGFGGTS